MPIPAMSRCWASVCGGHGEEFPVSDQPSQHPITSEEDAIRVLLILRLLKGEEPDDPELRQQRIDTFEALLRAWQPGQKEGD